MLCKFFKLLIYSVQTKCSVAAEEVTETGTEEAVGKPPKKKKKKKAPEPCEAEGGSTGLAGVSDVTVKEESDLQSNDHVNGLWGEEEPRKKRKKKKKQDEQDPVFHGSDSSGYQSDHKKKRRHSEEAELTPLVEHSHKKKREK